MEQTVEYKTKNKCSVVLFCEDTSPSTMIETVISLLNGKVIPSEIIIVDKQSTSPGTQRLLEMMQGYYDMIHIVYADKEMDAKAYGVEHCKYPVMFFTMGLIAENEVETFLKG